jgi:5,10-methylenetetrahydromethanopterin reductase
MLRTIGEIADGGLPLLFPPEHYRTVMPYIREGAEQAGRNIDIVDVAACIWCSIGHDYDTAVDALKEKIAYYGYALSPMILSNLGLTRADFAQIEHLVTSENDVVKAKSLVTEAMLRIGIAGTTRNVIERLEGLVEMGVQHISLGPPLGPDPLAAIIALGKDVLPYFGR